MKTRVSRVAAATLGAAALVGTVLVVASTAAGASPNVNYRHGFTIRTAHHVTGHNKLRVPVHASVKPRAGIKGQVLGWKMSAYQHGHRVGHGHVLHLRPGKYRVNVHATYRYWHYVSHTRTVTTRHDPDYGYPELSTCTITAVDPDLGWATRASCTSSHYPGQTVTDYYPATQESGDNYVGQRVHDYFAGPYKAYNTYSHQRYSVKAYGPRHTLTSPKRTVIVVNKTTSHRSSAGYNYTTVGNSSCTHTSSGSCIKGGQFCPQHSYGDVGTDAHGDLWVCDGDYTHPHWT